VAYALYLLNTYYSNTGKRRRYPGQQRSDHGRRQRAPGLDIEGRRLLGYFIPGIAGSDVFLFFTVEYVDSAEASIWISSTTDCQHRILSRKTPSKRARSAAGFVLIRLCYNHF
jgi:hypothetical protein